MTAAMIGYASAVVLLATTSHQVWRQWRTGTSHGVSPWLFVGQLVASAGLGVYSILVRELVFVVTNALMMVSAVAGGIVVWRHRQRDALGPSVSDHWSSSRARSGPPRRKTSNFFPSAAL